MNNRDSKEYTIWDAITPQAVTSSTDATPIVVTKASHGFANGDLVMINGHATNIAANGIFRVANRTANTFELTNYNTGANIAGSGAGAGSGGVLTPAPKIATATDFKAATFSISTSGSASLTLKIAASNGLVTNTNQNTPNFGATISASNPYSFVQIVNLDDGILTNGTTGIVLAGTDINRLYEVNTNFVKYICPIVTAYSAGVITIKMTLSSNL
jgi:hypothetical protein